MQMSRYLRKIYLCIYAVTRIHLILYQIYDILYEEKNRSYKKSVNTIICCYVDLETIFKKKKLCTRCYFVKARLNGFRRRFCKLFFAKKLA